MLRIQHTSVSKILPEKTSAVPEALGKVHTSPDQLYPRAAILFALHLQREFSFGSQLLKRSKREHYVNIYINLSFYFKHSF